MTDEHRGADKKPAGDDVASGREHGADDEAATAAAGAAADAALDAATDAVEAGENNEPVDEPEAMAEAPADEEADDETVEQPAPPRRRRSVFAGFAFLLALIALLASGYLFWLYELAPRDAETELARTVSHLGERVGDAERSVATSESETAALAGDVTALDERLTAQVQALRAAENALAEAVAVRRNLEPPTSRDWKLAEVEYLLRIANHRLLMERDAEAAADLLATADVILEELDDFAMHEVRARLADERMSLVNVQGVDIQGIFLRLEAIKNQLAELPIRLPQYVSKPPEAATSDEAEESTWQLLIGRLFSLVRVQRHEGLGIRPLLGPDEAMYLEQNLRLALERAQLAALREDQVMFEVSLESIQAWLAEYLKQDDLAVQAVTREVDALLGVQLSRDVPDISGSLNRLRALRSAGPAAGES